MAVVPEKTGAGLATEYVPLEVVACSMTYDVAVDTPVQESSATSLEDDAQMNAPTAPPCSAVGEVGALAAVASPGALGDVTVQLVPEPGGPAEVIVSPADGADVVPSAEVETANDDVAYVPARPLTNAMVNEAAVELARAQVLAPLLAR